ncbi:nuclear transport factor 2 family protein [Chitinophaga varians]|uniref:nuclear transport factor 2 family protein n=1 Tax=Chitinophaga varians TaxID=2202339 RepID=UPI00165FCCE1|nr:nuclear transport factor 2 family protein [Chitinophaga varians]MBC9909711.1 nuclear transport factor 2 family protein [Chitinophaga varians]
MSSNNKAVLEKANAAVAAGDNEGFLHFCTDDTEWTFVGDRTLRGKEAVRQYMAQAYAEPPIFMVEQLIAEGEWVTAIGNISMKDEHGKMIDYAYCDVWRFRDGKMAALKAFVIATGPAR